MELVRCEKCEEIESEQIVVRQKSTELFLAGDEAGAAALDLKETDVINRLKDHQALEHDHEKVYEGQLPRT